MSEISLVRNGTCAYTEEKPKHAVRFSAGDVSICLSREALETALKILAAVDGGPVKVDVVQELINQATSVGVVNKPQTITHVAPVQVPQPVHQPQQVNKPVVNNQNKLAADKNEAKFFCDMLEKENVKYHEENDKPLTDGLIEEVMKRTMKKCKGRVNKESMLMGLMGVTAGGMKRPQFELLYNATFNEIDLMEGDEA